MTSLILAEHNHIAITKYIIKIIVSHIISDNDDKIILNKQNQAIIEYIKNNYKLEDYKKMMYFMGKNKRLIELMSNIFIEIYSLAYP